MCVLDIFLTFLDLEQKPYICMSALKLSTIKYRIITMNPDDFRPDQKFKMTARRRFSQKKWFKCKWWRWWSWRHSGWGWIYTQSIHVSTKFSSLAHKLRVQISPRPASYPPLVLHLLSPVGSCSSWVCLQRHLALQAAGSKSRRLANQNSPISSGRDGIHAKPLHLQGDCLHGTR